MYYHYAYRYFYMIDSIFTIQIMHHSFHCSTFSVSLQHSSCFAAVKRGMCPYEKINLWSYGSFWTVCSPNLNRMFFRFHQVVLPTSSNSFSKSSNCFFWAVFSLRGLWVKLAMTVWGSLWRSGRLFHCWLLREYFFCFLLFRRSVYLVFNAPNAPRYVSQYAVVPHGLLRAYLLACIFLTELLAFEPFWYSFA